MQTPPNKNITRNVHSANKYKCRFLPHGLGVVISNRKGGGQQGGQE